jgi:hypothetical protein
MDRPPRLTSFQGGLLKYMSLTGDRTRACLLIVLAETPSDLPRCLATLRCQRAVLVKTTEDWNCYNLSWLGPD